MHAIVEEDVKYSLFDDQNKKNSHAVKNKKRFSLLSKSPKKINNDQSLKLPYIVTILDLFLE